MTPEGKLEVGDIVEVLRFKREDGIFREHWIPAIVINIEHPYGFDVKAVNGAFNEAGDDLRALPFSEKSKMWRR